MKFLKKQSVAILVMVLAIVASAVIGIGKGPVGGTPEPNHQPGQNAYALDGGQTTVITMCGDLISRPDFEHQRQISDIIYFATAIPNGD